MLVIYLAIELQGLCFYSLCVINRSANGATEAAIKYLLMSGLASSLLLFGTSLRYGETGTTNFSLWLELQDPGTPILANSLWIFIVVALLIKIAASPFHMWAPDLYEGAPLIVTAFIAIVPKIALFKIIAVVCSFSLPVLYLVLISSAILSVATGAIGAFNQNNLAR